MEATLSSRNSSVVTISRRLPNARDEAFACCVTVRRCPCYHGSIPTHRMINIFKEAQRIFKYIKTSPVPSSFHHFCIQHQAYIHTIKHSTPNRTALHQRQRPAAIRRLVSPSAVLKAGIRTSAFTPRHCCRRSTYSTTFVTVSIGVSPSNIPK